MSLRIRQINCGKRIASTINVTKWNDCDVTLIQEPNRGSFNELRKHGKVFTTGRLPRSAIFVSHSIDCTLVPQFSNRDIITLQIESQKTYLCSAYLDIKEHVVWPPILHSLVDHCARTNSRLIIGTDVNAHSELWGSPDLNARGEAIELAIVQHGLYVHNIGNTPTFHGTRKRRHGRLGPAQTHIDVTISNIPGQVTGWMLSDLPSYSDHRILEYTLHHVVSPEMIHKRNVKKINWNTVAKELKDAVPGTIPQTWTREQLEQHCTDFTAQLKTILDKYAPRKPPAKRHSFWWDDNCTAARHACTRAEKNARNRATYVNRARLRDAHRNFRDAIYKAKRASWREFIKEVDSVPDMARVNKIMNRVKGPVAELGLVKAPDGHLANSKQESLELMLNEHFPESQEAQMETLEPQTPIELLDLPWITTERFRTAVSEFKPGKAPGPDEFRAECLQALDNNTIKYITTLYKASISLAYVPQPWREVEVIFIPKPGKTDYTEMRSFRPISLMSVLFKTLERMTLWHIEEKVLLHKPIHRNQFGFRKGKSTEHALSKTVNIIEKGLYQGQYVLGVFCDISGAFDNVTLASITSSMRDRGIDDSIIQWYDHFLQKRTARSTLGSASAAIQPGKGAPQGGVLSAIIAWNLVFDELLEIFDGHDSPITAIGFADDGTLLITGIDIPSMYTTMQRALDHAQAWAQDHGLSFCPKKTNALLFTRKTVDTDALPHLQMYGQNVPNVTSTKLLGVTLDRKLSWGPHINNKIAACKRALMQLRPILRKTWSPKPKHTRWLYEGVIVPMLTYGSVVWASATHTITMQKRLSTLQRLGLTSITSVRRSTPTASLEIIYNMPPLHLLIQERALNTILRLNNLHEALWHPNVLTNIGHIRTLHRQLPQTPSDDVLGTPLPNRDQPYQISIQPELPPATEGIRVFTDGSLMNEQSGSGVYLVTPDTQLTMYERLSTCTVFQTEIYAINMACFYLRAMQTSNQQITIHVDSQAALYALQASSIKSKLVHETVTELNQLSTSNEVRLQWVKAHVGTEGNEEADKAAKAGSRLARIGYEVPGTKAVLKREIREARNQAWTEIWATTEGHRQSKHYLQGPQPDIWRDLKKLPPDKIGRTIRFITGHGFMNRHNTLIKFKNKTEAYNDPEAVLEMLCKLCEEQEETPLHIVTECPVLNTLRLSTLYQWQLDTPPPWGTDLINFINSTEVADLESTLTTGM